jgi:hypothetical protein
VLIKTSKEREGGHVSHIAVSHISHGVFFPNGKHYCATLVFLFPVMDVTLIEDALSQVEPEFGQDPPPPSSPVTRARRTTFGPVRTRRMQQEVAQGCHLLHHPPQGSKLKSKKTVLLQLLLLGKSSFPRSLFLIFYSLIMKCTVGWGLGTSYQPP